MIVDLDREDLKYLIKGCEPSYSVFNEPLLLKAGHRYYEQHDRTSWYYLDDLTDQELYHLYKICKYSWNK